MSDQVFSDIVSYFDSLAVELRSAAEQSAILENPTAVGSDREDVYRRFLERHAPRSCEAFLGGYIFDSAGHRSKQVDVILTASASPRYEMGSGPKAIAPIEGVVASVEVKSRLDKEKLFESLENVASIPVPTGPERAQKLNVPKQPVHEDWWWDLPYKIIFAYDGIAKETLSGHLNDFYHQNPDIPQECRPSLIHVLDEYVLFRISSDMNVLEPDGSVLRDQPSPGSYRWFNCNPDVQAMTFMFPILARNAYLLNNLIPEYGKYIPPTSKALLARPYCSTRSDL